MLFFKSYLYNRTMISNPHDAPEIELGQLLMTCGWKLVTAESCTGGLLSHRITNVAGSSQYFLGGFVSYAYEAKQAWLGVSQKTLEEFGAVSRETVREMAAGARQALNQSFDSADILAVSISGIAGPDGGTPQKPVGTIWLGVNGPLGAQERLLKLNGSRAEIKTQSAEFALELLLEYCRNNTS